MSNLKRLFKRVYHSYKSQQQQQDSSLVREKESFSSLNQNLELSEKFNQINEFQSKMISLYSDIHEHGKDLGDLRNAFRTIKNEIEQQDVEKRDDSESLSKQHFKNLKSSSKSNSNSQKSSSVIKKVTTKTR
ncbi:hypothetical protein AKO1_001344 [Acrasis kona]|uniref:Uncharacterized protein n=1 Tax=Acrasis kona TaxID=1008807 RepID=A0AAW2ZDV3_9EUKA